MSSVTAAQAYADEFKALGAKSRIGLARGLAGAAESVEAMPGAEVVEKASQVKQVTQATALVHAWGHEAPTFKMNLWLTSQNQMSEAMEAECREALPAAEELP